MSKIRRHYWLHVLTLTLGGFAYTALAIYASAFWLLGLLVMLIGAGVGLARLECVLCGDSLLLREHQMFGRDIALWWPLLPDQCPTCDHPVDEVDGLEPSALPELSSARC
jgi:hypothetical protein